MLCLKCHRSQQHSTKRSFTIRIERCDAVRLCECPKNTQTFRWNASNRNLKIRSQTDTRLIDNHQPKAIQVTIKHDFNLKKKYFNAQKKKFAKHQLTDYS